MKKIVNAIKFVYGCFVVIKNPLETDIIISVAVSLAKPEKIADAIEFQRSQPGGAEIFEKKPLVTRFDLDQLIQLPQNTFGYKYANHMKINKLDQDFFTVPFHDDATYAFYRYGKVHDLWHVMTAYDTTIPGELALLGFTFSQSLGPGAALITALAFLHGVIFKPWDLKTYVEAFADGLHVGKKAKNLFATDWDSLMNRPYEDVRREYNFI